MKSMSPRRAPTAARPARETESAPSPGLEAAWAHPLLGRVLRGQRRHERMDRRYPWVLDTAIVLFILLISLPDALSHTNSGPFGETGTNPHQLPSGVLIGFTVALVVPLWWRRKAPAATFFVIALVSLVVWSTGVWLNAGISTLVALYTLALRGSPRMLGWAAALTFIEVVLAAFVLVQVSHPLLASFFLLGTATAAIATGLTLRVRQMYLAALEEQAARLKVERDQRARLTAAAERSRVAREMHDIVGHNLSVMVSVADGAATLAANNDERSAEALRILGETGRQAMGEMRRVLGVLREEQQDAHMLSPQPGIRDLEPLLARVRAAGLTVTYRTKGDLDALGGGVQLTVYRIVQEALTNTLKYAGPGSSAEVTVAADTDTDTDTDAVHVRIADTGAPVQGADGTPGTRPAPQIGEPGHGLVGIRQRAAMYGGTVTIGPRTPGPGWIVDVRLDTPLASAPPAAPIPGEDAP